MRKSKVTGAASRGRLSFRDYQDRRPPGRALGRMILRCWPRCAPWTVTLACAPTCASARPTPTFRSRSAFRRLSMGAGGEGGGAHTLHEWYSAKDRELALKRVLLLTLAMRSGPRSSSAI